MNKVVVVICWSCCLLSNNIVCPRAHVSDSRMRRGVLRVVKIYMTVHFLLLPVRRRRAARVACSKTSLTPSFILAEHSRYLVAPILRATASP